MGQRLGWVRGRSYARGWLGWLWCGVEQRVLKCCVGYGCGLLREFGSKACELPVGKLPGRRSEISDLGDAKLGSSRDSSVAQLSYGSLVTSKGGCLAWSTCCLAGPFCVADQGAHLITNLIHSPCIKSHRHQPIKHTIVQSNQWLQQLPASLK